MNAQEVIGRKRDGLVHSPDEIGFLVRGYLDGSILDYQMSAWLMAVCTRGMDSTETLHLTQALVDSGEVLDLSSIPGVKVDKHSTGGVGDKVTLVAGPVAAACGVRVPKLSGRALAHTGGTLDKLESVPGVSVDLPPDRFIEQVRCIGLAVAAQSERMVPADKAIYALRDASATVPSVPLIASSVMSKKLAAGADAIVLDVKFGRGAFMAGPPQAVAIGEGARRPTVALVTAMENPLGRCIGNAIEVEEALEVLSGGGEAELRRVCLAVAAEMCGLAGVDCDAVAAIESGAALDKLWEMLEAQGGRRDRPPRSHPRALTVTSLTGGWVESIDALECGLAVIDLGGGRVRKEDAIDHGVGLEVAAVVGDRVEAGDPLVHVHAPDDRTAARAEPRLRRAWKIAGSAIVRPPHLLYRVDRSGSQPAADTLLRRE